MRAERFHPPGDTVPALALFIMKISDGTHTGILHRIQNTVFIQDMLWHEQLRSEPCVQDHYFVTPELEEEEINDVTGICRLIHTRHNSVEQYRIPYALRYHGTERFNAVGELMLSDGLGLTCSTFVLTVFESAKVPLIGLETWELRVDDEQRHNSLLEWMRNGIGNAPPAKSEHVTRVQEELPCIRVRPEEVAASGMFDLPATFAQLEPAGQWVLQRLSGS